jgi:hypothetical protein
VGEPRAIESLAYVFLVGEPAGGHSVNVDGHAVPILGDETGVIEALRATDANMVAVAIRSTWVLTACARWRWPGSWKQLTPTLSWHQVSLT